MPTPRKRPAPRRLITNQAILEALPDAAQPGQCTYSAPCALGAAMTPAERDWLRMAGLDHILISEVLAKPGCPFTFEDPEAAFKVQGLFDIGGNRLDFARAAGALLRP